MKDIIKKILFADKPLFIRIWMWMAILCTIFYLIKFSVSNPVPTELDMILMAFGTGSIALYVLIFGFDWSK